MTFLINKNMAENLNNIETIEAYLRGKLDGTELDKFEQQLNADPSLKSEVQFQKTIQDGLFEIRRLELKNRLNNIPIAPAFQWTIGKIAAGVALVSLIGFGIYSLNNKKEVLVEENQSTPLVKKEINSNNEVVVSENSIDNTKSIEPSNNFKSVPKTTKSTIKETQKVEEIVHSGDIHLPNIPLEHGYHHVDKHTDGTTPNGKIEQIGTVNISSLSPEIINNKDKFHYKYYADKLVLVGDFSKGPYELIELNKNDAKNLYLYYDGDFFELHYGTEKLDQLVRITQVKLHKELKNKIKK